MFKLLRFLFTGSWGPAPSVRTLAARVGVVEERCDYLQKQISRLRGHVTGAMRYGEEEPENPTGPFPLGIAGVASPHVSFPEEEFLALVEEKRHHG
jgi:hypothetical protein